MYMERRRKLQDEEDLLQRQTYYLHPERYKELFVKDERQPEPLSVVGRTIEEVVDEIDKLDAYFDRLEEKREVRGSDLRYLEPDAEGWV